MPTRPGTHKPIKVVTHTHQVSEPNWGKGRGGRPWQRTREQVFRRDNYLCQIDIKRGITRPVRLHGPDAGVCDHVVAQADGGSDDIENLQTICQDCDKEKTAKESARGSTRAR